VELFLPHTQEYMVMKILAIDLGKYKSVACNYVTATGRARFATAVTHVIELDRLLSQECPDRVSQSADVCEWCETSSREAGLPKLLEEARLAAPSAMCGNYTLHTLWRICGSDSNY